MAQYRVTLEATSPSGDKQSKDLYVSAPDTKSGYRAAREKAEMKMKKLQMGWFKAVSAYCVS